MARKRGGNRAIWGLMGRSRERKRGSPVDPFAPESCGLVRKVKLTGACIQRSYSSGSRAGGPGGLVGSAVFACLRGSGMKCYRCGWSGSSAQSSRPGVAGLASRARVRSARGSRWPTLALGFVRPGPMIPALGFVPPGRAVEHRGALRVVGFVRRGARPAARNCPRVRSARGRAGGRGLLSGSFGAVPDRPGSLFPWGGPTVPTGRWVRFSRHPTSSLPPLRERAGERFPEAQARRPSDTLEAGDGPSPQPSPRGRGSQKCLAYRDLGGCG
jgi:hypothetical protein